MYLKFRPKKTVISQLKDYEVLEIKISKTDKSLTGSSQLVSLAAENMFAAIHGLLKEDPSQQEHFSFEIVSSVKEGIRFYAVVPTNIVKFVESQIYAQYPSCQIKVVEDYLGELDVESKLYDLYQCNFTKPHFFPLKSFRDFEIDPLSSITSALANVKASEKVAFQIVLKPIPDIWQAEGHKYTNALRDGKEIKKVSVTSSIGGIFANFFREFINIAAKVAVGLFMVAAPAPPTGGSTTIKTEPKPALTPVQQTEIQSIENKLSKMGYAVVLRVLVAGETLERTETHARSFFAALQQYTSINLNGLVHRAFDNKVAALADFAQRSFDTNLGLILNIEELATLYHFPSSDIATPTISWIYSKKSEPPSNLPVDDCTYIGHTLYRSKKVMFGIKNGDDRLRHMYLIGKSGVGKSSLFETMMSQDIHNGFGVAILDPHGETVEHILDRIPDHRVEDVIYVDPSDSDNPVGLNLMEIDDPNQKNILASGLLAAIKHHFEQASWGPRLEYLLNNAILTLLEVPGTTMLGITRLLEDKNYQSYILHYVKDPALRRFWDVEYKEFKTNQKLVTEAVAPIQNKVNRFLASSTMRNILGQKRSTINIADAMNSRKILLINLSKGKIGADNSNLLGALLLSRIQFYALQRANMAEQDRVPFYLYVDEFQNFASGSFEEILSESRKYKLGLYLTHQFTAQLPETLLSAVYGNVGTIATFAVGAPDANAMSKEFSPYFEPEDIISLERFHIYVKLMIDGMTSLPFSAEILRPWEEDFPIKKTGNKQRVIELSRQKYGVKREYVEEKIAKWFDTSFDKGLAIALEQKKQKQSKIELTEGDK